MLASVKPSLFALACLALVAGLAGCGSDSTGPEYGSIVIDIQPDDCPLTWTLTGADDTITGTGDRRIDTMPADREYTVAIAHDPGWIPAGDVTTTFVLQPSEAHDVLFAFDPLVLGAFVEVPAGTFTMGSPEEQAGSHEDERPQHEVTFTRALLVKATEVTQREYLAIMNDRPSAHTMCDECPVERVDFQDAVDFCNRLSEWADLTPVYSVEQDTVRCDWDADGYRLPTESEWEYACRAGTSTRFSFGDDPADLDDYAWYGDNSNDRTHPVGLKPPNPWGLYDMHGNVFEMTWDGYFYYPDEPVTDPRRDPHNENRMARGGDYHWDWDWATSSWRGTYTPEQRIPNLGFRVVRYAGSGKADVPAGSGHGGGRPVDGRKGIGN
jgi:formylglycine-generating enzyme required for sulfatase activity